MKYVSPITMAIKQNKREKTNVAEDVEKLESSYIDGGNVKWGGCYRKQLRGSS